MIDDSAPRIPLNAERRRFRRKARLTALPARALTSQTFPNRRKRMTLRTDSGCRLFLQNQTPRWRSSVQSSMFHMTPAA